MIDEVDFLFKVVIIGDSGVGKSNILKRMLNKEFDENSKSTVGVDFGTIHSKVKESKCQIQIWDTAGQERFRSITSVYYKGTHGAIIVYDITSQNSFNSIENWYNDLKSYITEDILLILIGNKSDLKDSRIISEEVARKKAKDYNMLFIETSAKDNVCIKEAIDLLFNNLYEKHKSELSTDNQPNIKFDKGNTVFREEHKSCC